ncbi:MAG: nucleotide exchange factor GrpE [Lachnospiraceae bacterium]|nr:nucleotide exchange factor GrpE [Lachnospiraceae bacterium]
MSDVKEELIKEAIRKAAEEAAERAEDEADAEIEAEDEAEEIPIEDGDGEETGEEVEEGSEEKKKVSLFSKKDKKDKKDVKIEELTGKVEELNDRLLRNLAEFDNFRKRNEKEKAQMFEVGAKTIVEKILPTIDNFERGLASVPEDKKDDPFVQGMDKVYRQLMSSLEEAGVKPIEAVGKEFDPNLHNAVMHEENEEFGENTVSEELQKGYMYRDSVVRHSMVKVAN